MKTKLLYLFIFLSFTSCSLFKDASFGNNKAKGKAGIVRIPQFVDKNEKGIGKDKGTFMWSHYDATKRGSLMFIDKNENIRVLAENPPDAAIQSITSITTSSNVDGKVDASLAFETSKSIAELGKRTAGVNMLRDALYRLNEMYYASKDERDEDRKILNNAILNKNNEVINYLKTKNTNNDGSEKELSTLEIKDLFKLIVNNAKDLGIKEAEADIEKSKSDIPKYETNKVEFEKQKLQIEALSKLLDIAKDSLTKKEVLKFKEDILKIKNN